ncbi:hypothetical protein [Sphingobium sp. Ndbn-10]|uniref:hypothetical protein n=1 Tax=Sphingobium sp. Ndbn-10 TaxID=1667223 RepID=UPI00147E25A8|nr:hypothetical protein [Sphingobium sp. Ndbn-10]
MNPASAKRQIIASVKGADLRNIRREPKPFDLPIGRRLGSSFREAFAFICVAE